MRRSALGNLRTDEHLSNQTTDHPVTPSSTQVPRRTAHRNRNPKRTHDEPILDPIPRGCPVLLAQRRIRQLLPSTLYRRLTPDVYDRLYVPPIIHPANKIPHGFVFPGRIFSLVGGKRGEEVCVRVDDRGRCCVGVGGELGEV